MYYISFMPLAKKFLKKRDKHEQSRILKKLRELSRTPELGEPLKGTLKGFYRLRFGKFRAIYRIFNNILVISVVDLDVRGKIYKKY